MLNYQLEGKGNTVVFLHGYLESLIMWEDFAKKLSNDYQILRIDLPGHGKSPVYGEIHTMELMAEKVREVLTELNIKKADFIGHSMGGYVALAYADKYPEQVKSFVLLNSTFSPDSEEKKEMRLRAAEVARKDMEALIKMSVPNLFNPHKKDHLKNEIEFAKKMARETPIDGITSALKGMRLRPDRLSVLETFDKPILIIIGKYDQAIDEEKLKKQIPNKPNISEIVLETGHMAYLESPKETLNELKKFLKRDLVDNVNN